jgi:phage terminase large subunit-like protein
LPLSTPELLGVVHPRYGTPRHPERPTFGGVDAEVARLLGWEFFPWQRHAADVAGEYVPSTRLPCYRTVGIGVARQNGKTALVCTRIARQLIQPRQTVAYTAQDRTVAVQKWEEHVELLMATPFADHVDHVPRVNHREVLIMKNGSRYLPVTPTKKKAARSMSIDLAVIDEAHAHPTMEIVGALQPTMATRKSAQLWVVSNAGDENSGLWKNYTVNGRQAIDDPTSTLCWLEYAAAEHADPRDRQSWTEANPSLGHRGGVLVEALADAAAGMDTDTFRREHQNIWIDARGVAAIDPVVWAMCHDDNISPGRRLWLALDFTAERDRGALVAAGDELGRIPLEVVEHGPDLELLLTRTAEIAKRHRATVVLDRLGPAGSAEPMLRRAGCTVKFLSSTDVAAACASFHDTAVRGDLAHQGDPRLNAAIQNATKRQFGDRWTWERRSNHDITCLWAATLAAWAVLTLPAAKAPAIY